MTIRTPYDASVASVAPKDTASLGVLDALREITSERVALQYESALQGMGLSSTRQILALSQEDLKQMQLPPHMRSVLRQVRGEEVNILEGTPVDGYVTTNLFRTDTFLYILPILFAANFLAGGDSFFGLVERLLSMAVLCVILALLLIRSFYLLMCEQEIGQLRVTRGVDDDGVPKKTFKVKVIVHKKDATVRAASDTYECVAEGDDVGVMLHEIVLHPLLIYLGLSDRVCWSSVVAVDPATSRHQHPLVLSSINPSTWASLESLPYIPGIRAIQRVIVFKVAPDGAAYLVKKDPHGRVWLAQA